MADEGKKVDIDKLFSLADDMLKVLTTNKDGHALLQSSDTAITIMSSFLSSSNHLHASIQDCQNKVNACQRDTERVKSESLLDDVLVRTQKDLDEINKQEESLLQQLRETNAKLEELDRQRISVQEKNDTNRQKEKNIVKSNFQDIMIIGFEPSCTKLISLVPVHRLPYRKVLSMCASVTNIVPNLYDKDKISGYILDKNKKRVETFEFENTDFDACNKLWKMLSK